VFHAHPLSSFSRNSFNEPPFGAGPNSYSGKGLIFQQKNRKKNIFFFELFKKNFQVFWSPGDQKIGHRVTKIGHRRFGHRTARHPFLLYFSKVRKIQK
jgi:hypothetical protein